MVLSLGATGAVVFSVAMAVAATIGTIVLVNAVRFTWTNRRRR